MFSRVAVDQASASDFSTSSPPLAMRTKRKDIYHGRKSEISTRLIPSFLIMPQGTPSKAIICLAFGLTAISTALPAQASWEGSRRYTCRFNKGAWIGTTTSYLTSAPYSFRINWDDGLSMTYTPLPNRATYNNLYIDKLGGFWHHTDYRNDKHGNNWFDMTNVDNGNIIECRRSVTPP